jgi:hypothetical protein
MTLRLTEAQQLHEALNDALLRPALIAFFEEQQAVAMSMLVRAVRQPSRDTMREARFAGQVEAYENALADLEHFAKEQLKTASSPSYG